MEAGGNLKGLMEAQRELLVPGSWWKLPLSTSSGSLRVPPKEVMEASMEVNDKREYRGGPTDLRYYLQLKGADYVLMV